MNLLIMRARVTAGIVSLSHSLRLSISEAGGPLVLPPHLSVLNSVVEGAFQTDLPAL